MYLRLNNENINCLKVFLVIFGVIAVLCFGAPTPAGALEPDSAQTSCSIGEAVDITVDSPVTDSVVASSPLQVTGVVKGATQIETSIDGAYSTTTSVMADQDSFSIPVELPGGRHSIRLVAHSGCGEKASALVYVRLQPEDSAPDDGLVTGGGVHVGGTETIGGDKVGALDVLGQLTNDAFKNPIASAVHLGLILIGFLLIGFSSWLGSRFNGGLSRQVWRVAGIVLIIATFSWVLA